MGTTPMIEWVTLAAAVLPLALFPLAGCGRGLPPGEGTARVNGVDLHYVIAGKGPVIVVHPGGPGLEWRYVRMPRVESFATVVYLDPRGSGGSSRLPRLEDYRMEKMVDDLEALRRRLGLERMVLLGHSHGGMVAQLYALRHQARLRKLVLCDTVAATGPEWSAEVQRNARRRASEPWYAGAAAALAEEPGAKTEEDLRELLKREIPLYFHRWEPFREQVLKDLEHLRLSPEPLRAFSELDAPAFDTRERLGVLRVPTLILTGRHDFIGPPERAEEMHALIPGSRLFIFETSGHFPYMEEAGSFALTLRAFLVGG